jgi:hypothetical protein
MEGLIGSDDFYLVANPIRRQINPAAVATGFDPLFDHLLTVYFKFHLSSSSAFLCISFASGMLESLFFAFVKSVTT